MSLSACSQQNDLNPDERQLLLNERDFSAVRVEREGSYKKSVQYFNRIVELSYVNERSKGFYLYSGVTLNPNASDALIQGYAGKFGASQSLKSNDVSRQELPLSEAFPSGSSLDLLLKNGKPMGNMFFTRAGNKSVFIFFAGVHFEQAADFEAFIQPYLQRVRGYESRDPLLGWFGDLFASRKDNRAQPKNQ